MVCEYCGEENTHTPDCPALFLDDKYKVHLGYDDIDD